MDTIQSSLKKYLAASGMTQADFSRKAGIDPVALYKFLKRTGGDAIAERVYPYIHEFVASGMRLPAPGKETRRDA